MDLIRPELSELFPLEFAKIAASDFYTIASTNIDQLVPNMVTVYIMMSLIWVKSDSDIWSYLPLNKEKLLNLTLFTLQHLQIITVYTTASTNNNQSAQNLVTMNIT